MKIESIIIDPETGASSYLKKCLLARCPEIVIKGEATNYGDARKLIASCSPGLVFSDMNVFSRNQEAEFSGRSPEYEIIYTSNQPADAVRAFRQEAGGFLLKPLNAGDIVASVGSVVRKLSEKSKQLEMPADVAKTSYNQLVGIPSMEGIEFLSIQEIVRFEGLQKYTRVVTMRKNNLISAYNIGEFRKLLETSGFFSCHKSHLINLLHVRRYTREGFIFLTDNFAVPLARRKKPEFLQLLRHL